MESTAYEVTYRLFVGKTSERVPPRAWVPCVSATGHSGGDHVPTVSVSRR